MLDFEEAARRVHLGRSIAFFGAAFSPDATNLDDEGMASASKLAAFLSGKLGEAAPLPLDLASQEYVRKGLIPDLREIITHSFTTKRVASYQSKLAQLPWQRVYTTNYDDIVEFARRTAGLSSDTATSLDRPADYSGRFSVVHLHGSVTNVSKDNWDDATVLTNEQYASDILRESGWLETFRNDVNYADSIFFFGYSMADLDIARLMYENPTLAEKTFIVAGMSPSRGTEIRTQGYGRLVKLDVAGAAEAFPAKNDPSAVKPAPYLVNLQEVSTSAADARPARDNVVNFLVKGDLDFRYVARDLANGTHDYFVSRDTINLRAGKLGSSPERLLLHSRLGGGKTCAVAELCHYFLISGWRVLSFNGNTEGFEYDIDFLANLGSEGQRKTAVIFESCFSFSSTIKDLIERYPLLSIICTTRSAVLQTRIGSVDDSLGDGFEVIDLDEITDQEAEDLDDLLHANGMWGERQGYNRAKRLDYIKKKARADLPTVLVDVCRSSDIFARVGQELKAIEQLSRDLRKSLVTTLCLTCAGSRLNMNQICDVVETDLFKYGKYQSNPALKEFIDFERGRVAARSSTFAQAVLKDIIPDHLIIDILPAVIARLDRLGSEHDAFNDPLKGMMRFGFIESIFNDEGKEAKLVSFYEAVRATGVVAGNPQFWLQYAIACMSFGDYPAASDHFKSAFGLAGSKGGYDPYQIENQYAKFLLESRSKTTIWNDQYNAFNEAHEIVSKQMNNFHEGYYPYRVARLYLTFTEVNEKIFTPGQRTRISNWCSQLIKLGNNAPKSVRRSNYWRQGMTALEQTIEFLKEG